MEIKIDSISTIQNRKIKLMAHKKNTVKYTQTSFITKLTIYTKIDTHDQIPKYTHYNPVEQLWLQGKLQWAASIDNWTKPYHHMPLRNLQKKQWQTKDKNYEQYDCVTW